MRTPQYLSPTSLKMFYTDRDQYYMNYLSDLKPPRPPQTQPMAAGSAFDAYVKSYLVKQIMGKDGHDIDPAFDLENMLTAQVEPHNLEWARVHGRIIFEAYKKQGALADILFDLNQCIGRPRFELAIQGFAKGTLGNIPFLGKPDLYWLHTKGARVILDWKVNNYCGNNNISPKPGYVRQRTNDSTNGRAHPKAQAQMHNGLLLTPIYPLDSVEADWAAQATIYAWLLGEDIGSQFVVAIDQIVCNPDSMGSREFRIAQHRSCVTPKFQFALLEKANIAWDAIRRQHPFYELSKAESDSKCKMLDMLISAPRNLDLEELLR